MDILKRFPPEVLEILKNGGWFPGRKLDDDIIEKWRTTLLSSDHLNMPIAAEVVLREFGGLTVGSTGRGVNRATTSLDIYPLHAAGGKQEIDRLALAARVDVVYPLGIFGDHDGLVLIDAKGAVYVDYEMDSSVADNFDEALVKLLLGIK